jgi:predicted permease
MRKARAFLHRCLSLFRRNGWEQELREEMESNLELHIRDNIARGMSHEEARRQARIRMGSMDSVKEACREQRGLPFLEMLGADLRFSVRLLRKDFAFASLAIVTLATGIGAATIMFAVVNAVLIQPLPYPKSEQLVHLSEAIDRQAGMSIAYANFLDWQVMNHVFSSMGAIQPHALTLSSNSGPAELLDGRRVSHSFFRTLGMSPSFGRDFTQDDDRPSAEPVVILSYKFWQQRFGGRTEVLGTTLTLNREQHTVIGVLPADFSYNDEVPDAFVPIGLIKDRAFWQNRYNHSGTYAVARLKQGVSLEQARNDLDRVAKILQQQYPNTNGRNWVSLIPVREWMVGDIRKPLMILLAAVGLLLLIVCANIANLLLAKGSARAREVAIRLALGASKRRLLRQFLTESVLLASLGGIAGVFLAFWVASLLARFAVDAVPRATQIRIDPLVLTFAFIVSILSGILFGIAPALHVPGKPQLALKEGERASLSPTQERMRSGLVVGQIALSLALLLGAGLLIRSFERVMQVSPGFNSHQVLTGYLVLSSNRYKSVGDAEAFYREAISKVRAIPGVVAASTVTPMPMSGNESDTDYLRDDLRAEDLHKFPNSEIGWFGADYLSAMQIPLLAGRGFTKADNEHSLPVAIVNDEFVRRNWFGEYPIGKRIRLGDPKELSGPETTGSRWRTVVGVIGNVKQYGLDRRTVPTVYTPFAQTGSPLLRRDFVIRAGVSDPLSLTTAIRNAIASVDREQAFADVSTMDRHLAARLATRQLSMMLLGIFAMLALALGAVGIYGVVSYWVVQRTREIGIRVALGARRSQILGLILGRATLLLGLGLGIGVCTSFALARVLRSMLFGVGASDPAVFAVVILVLSGVATLGSYLPARRATKVDPVIALRYE